MQFVRIETDTLSEDAKFLSHGEMKIIEADGEMLSFLQGQVGGMIEPLSLHEELHGFPDEVATAWLNEEGKLTGLVANGRARELLEVHAGISPWDIPVGPVIVTGYEAGDVIGLSRKVAESIGLPGHVCALLDEEV